MADSRTPAPVRGQTPGGLPVPITQLLRAAFNGGRRVTVVFANGYRLDGVVTRIGLAEADFDLARQGRATPYLAAQVREVHPFVKEPRA